MWVPVAVWQPCELLYTCYLLTYLLTFPAAGHYRLLTGTKLYCSMTKAHVWTTCPRLLHESTTPGVEPTSCKSNASRLQHQQYFAVRTPVLNEVTAVQWISDRLPLLKASKPLLIVHSRPTFSVFVCWWSGIRYQKMLFRLIIFRCLLIIIIIIAMTMFMVLSARVHPVHLMNADWAPGGRQASDQANQLGLRVRWKLAATIHIHHRHCYYYSARRLILILPSHERWKAVWNV